VKRIVIWLASTVTVLVLLFGYHTSTDQATPAAGAGTASAAPSASVPSASSSGSSGSTSGSSGSSSGSSGGSSSSTKTTTGSVIQTRWGPVQVEITVTNDKIGDVRVVQYPNGNHRDAEINDEALPILVQETLDAQSAKIDMVSGATVTSEGYLKSLQSALDEAGR
jgi:uncharacterized protein with FMN-binding domain